MLGLFFFVYRFVFISVILQGFSRTVEICANPITIKMARIAGVEIPDNKRVEIALTYVKGIGRSRSQNILSEAGIDKDQRVEDLSAKEISSIQNLVENYDVEGALDRKVRQNIQRLKEIGCYRGKRHESGLPVRGQRTKTNSRTRKGRRDNRLGS